MGGHARTVIRSSSERHPGYTDQGAISAPLQRHLCTRVHHTFHRTTITALSQTAERPTVTLSHHTNAASRRQAVLVRSSSLPSPEPLHFKCFSLFSTGRQLMQSL